MSDSNSSATGTETGQQPQGEPHGNPDDGSQGQQPTDPAAQATEPTDWEAEATRLQGELAKARKWEARAKENKGAADKLAKLEEANKSESEKLLDRATKAEERAEKAEERYRTVTLRSAVIDAATTAGAIDTETVYLHLQARGGIDLDEDGSATGVEDAIKGLVKDKPHLFNATNPGARDATASGTPKASGSNSLENALRGAVGARQ